LGEPFGDDGEKLGDLKGFIRGSAVFQDPNSDPSVGVIMAPSDHILTLIEHEAGSSLVGALSRDLLDGP
jgi:hypothetical protein